MLALKVLKSPHTEIYSFKLTMLWLSLSSSLSSAKYFHQYSMHTTTVAMWAPAPCCIDSTLCLDMMCILYWLKYLAEDNEEERDNHSIVSLNECISV